MEAAKLGVADQVPPVTYNGIIPLKLLLTAVKGLVASTLVALFINIPILQAAMFTFIIGAGTVGTSAFVTEAINGKPWPTCLSCFPLHAAVFIMAGMPTFLAAFYLPQIGPVAVLLTALCAFWLRNVRNGMTIIFVAIASVLFLGVGLPLKNKFTFT